MAHCMSTIWRDLDSQPRWDITSYSHDFAPRTWYSSEQNNLHRIPLHVDSEIVHLLGDDHGSTRNSIDNLSISTPLGNENTHLEDLSSG